MNWLSERLVPTAFLLLLALPVPRISAAELRLVLPLGRAVCQSNERIDVSVARPVTDQTVADDILLKLTGSDASQLTFSFPSQRAVEHLHLNGWLLRPGDYQVEVSWGGATARTNLTVYSHIRRSEFKVINWGTAEGQDQLGEGEASLGYNLFYGRREADDLTNLMRAGVDFMANCVMSGGHQMDLRSECDWSDPCVIRGGTRRAAQRAFRDRTWPNVLGVHFFDEPGLTWEADPQNGERTPHAIPWQARSFEAAFGQRPLDWKQVDPRNPEHLARWRAWAYWKLGFLDAAWKDAQFAVSSARPDFISVSQSQYGYTAFTDGHYFNVSRSLPVTSGHGGYHDFGLGYLNPSYYLEFARARAYAKPNWYLPTWFGNTTADEFRLEQYLAFQCNLQGVISPPELDPARPEVSKAAQGIVESNHLLGRLGPVFNRIPVTRPPVALLFSLSQMVHTQTLDRQVNYSHNTAHGRNVMFVYLAGKLLQHQFMPVLDEEVLDGTVAAQHKAIILTSLDYLAAEVIGALESFAKRGGLVLLTADCTVKIQGGVRLDVTPGWPEAARIAALSKAGKTTEAGQLTSLRHALVGARTCADAIRPQLERAGIQPPLTSSEPGIVVTRQSSGDIEYIFAVNATHDPAGDPMLGIKAVTATLGVPDDGRPVYDVVHGRLAPEFRKQGGQLQGEFRFGPGQMRVFARTAHPVGAVKAAPPLVCRDYTRVEAPLTVELGAAVLDAQGGLSGGALPLRIRVQDPLGSTRYDLYRATDRGTLNLSLPLAINDPAGRWKVSVAELVSGREDTTTFTLPAVPDCNAAAGATRRAVHFAEDREHVFRFFRLYPQVTVVTGGSEFNAAAAERLVEVLKPWNVTCTIMSAATANRPRPLTEDEARTWIGLQYAAKGAIKPGEANPPAQVGFAVRGPVVLLGTPDDNPLIRFLAEQHFLPYKVHAGTLPGSGRGYLAWQREGIGVDQESITLIAYDAAGMNEAVGTVYEMLAGLEPLTPLTLPVASSIAVASRADRIPELAVDWSVVLADRIEGMKMSGDKLNVLTHAGTFQEVGADGTASDAKILEAADHAKLAQELRPVTDPAATAKARKSATPGHLVKLVLSHGDETAVAYWGGTITLFDKSGALRAARQCPQDITAIGWLSGRLVVGDADGRLTALIAP